jgi:hypothetical protein
MWSLAAYAVFCSAGFGAIAGYWWLAERRVRPA